MSVKIKIDPILQQFTNNQASIQVNGDTVIECLDELMRQFPGTEKWLFDTNGTLMALILFNQEVTYQRDLIRLVTDGDELHLVPIVGGG